MNTLLGQQAIVTVQNDKITEVCMVPDNTLPLTNQQKLQRIQELQAFATCSVQSALHRLDTLQKELDRNQEVTAYNAAIMVRSMMTAIRNNNEQMVAFLRHRARIYVDLCEEEFQRQERMKEKARAILRNADLDPLDYI